MRTAKGNCKDLEKSYGIDNRACLNSLTLCLIAAGIFFMRDSKKVRL